MSMLPAYTRHVQTRSGASLLQYLSCHSMRLRWQWAGKVHAAPARALRPLAHSTPPPLYVGARLLATRPLATRPLATRPLATRPQVYFVVMRNFFPTPPQLSFDLKGATANRRALKAAQLHQTNTVARMYNTLRDWEWMDIGMTTDLDPTDRER